MQNSEIILTAGVQAGKELEGRVAGCGQVYVLLGGVVPVAFKASSKRVEK